MNEYTCSEEEALLDTCVQVTDRIEHSSFAAGTFLLRQAIHFSKSPEALLSPDQFHELYARSQILLGKRIADTK